MKKSFWISQILALFFVAIMVTALFYYRWAIWSYDGPDADFQVKPGESFSSINYRLKKGNFISDARIFHRYSQLKELTTKFKSGQYIIKNGSTMNDVINTLLSGKGFDTNITIPEGKNLYEIGKILEEKGILKYRDFVAAAKSPEIIKELDIQGKTVEGYLYPDTYKFTPKSPAKVIIKAMVKEFFFKTGQLSFSHPKLNSHQLVILASIVEKETGASWERPRIAGVFHNRLKKKMRLQSDPTTIYGIYENFNGNLRKKHLLEKTPYNTYKINGLPEGPISNPGLESLKAVIEPEQHKYLYFVSKNDGTHIFSETYKQHRAAVETWQKNRKNRKGKSWRDLDASKK